MRMGDDDAEQVRALFDDIAQIWEDDIDARRFRAGEGEPAIDEDPFAPALRPPAIERGVHADFAEAAEGNEDELIAGAGHVGSLKGTAPVRK